MGLPSTARQAPVPDSQVSVNTAAWQEGVQALPQAPQLPGSALRSSSQPLPGLPSQSANPAAQLGEPQVPAAHTPVPLASGQAVPSEQGVPSATGARPQEPVVGSHTATVWQASGAGQLPPLPGHEQTSGCARAGGAGQSSSCGSQSLLS